MSFSDDHHRETLPVHPISMVPSPDHRLRIDGLVRQPLDLALADLMAFPGRTLVDDFTCVEGWTVPRLLWQGVAVADALARAGVRREARIVQASAGGFSVPLPLAVARTGLLALWLGGAPLPAAHGGPVRLVVPGQACFTSVKWLDHLELRATPATNTAEAIARGRLGGGDGSGRPPP